MAGKMRGIRRRLSMSVAALAVFFVFMSFYYVCPGADETLLSEPQVELIITQPWVGGDSIIQSVCATDEYIITLENTSKKEITADVVTAYYKNDTDAAGNPVEKYSVAMQVQDQDWEHGNCMTYNPNTGYVYVALYTNFNPDLRGCIYVMDPSNLSLIGTQKISDDFNILSIAYSPDEDIYYAQSDGEAGYCIFTMNTDFQIIENLGPADPTPGYNFQGFCKNGEYLLQSPLTVGLDVGDYMMAYSIPERAFVDCVPFNYGREGANKIETEEIAPMGDGSFVVAVNNKIDDETGYVDIFRVVFPNLPVDTSLLDRIEPAEPEVTPEPHADEEVTLTTEKEEMTSVETFSAEETPEDEVKAPGKPFNPVPLIIILVISAGAVLGIRMYIINLQRKRRARNERVRRARKLLIESMYSEIDDIDI